MAGRPRKYTDRQVVAILQWKAQRRRLEQARTRLCERFGITSDTFVYLSKANHKTRAP